ncbi:hypothetical protein LAZ67_21001222 [Cordylochernes scorpioides]|uniref:Ig-like domain-containing protein n=1 Tax=Cordylochernes scorpioides TaxID=51811 RepID=A0ABY6LLU3_9ARAC|nr:hypothetical protein LAZ67_21001222 [Cordylochernes scorpioides]
MRTPQLLLFTLMWRRVIAQTDYEYEELYEQIEDNENFTTQEVIPDVDGGWSKWGRWSVCSKTCAIGVRSRSRTCDNPAQSGDGSPCLGDDTDIENCDTGVTCPIHGGWTAWSAWDCSVSCGGGSGKRHRFCTNPKPKFGGRQCDGQNLQIGECGQNDCPESLYTLPPDVIEEVKKITEKNVNQIFLKEGDKTTLECPSNLLTKIFKKYFESAITWIRNGYDFPMDIERMKLESGSLNIEVINASDAGLYVCKALYAPRASAILAIISLVVVNDSVEIPENERFRFQSNALGIFKLFRKSKIFWYNNGKLYKETKFKRYLDIWPITKIHGGNWTCVVEELKTKRRWITNTLNLKVIEPLTLWERFLRYQYIQLYLGGGSLAILYITVSCLTMTIGKMRRDALEHYDRFRFAHRMSNILKKESSKKKGKKKKKGKNKKKKKGKGKKEEIGEEPKKGKNKEKSKKKDTSKEIVEEKTKEKGKSKKKDTSKEIVEEKAKEKGKSKKKDTDEEFVEEKAKEKGKSKKKDTDEEFVEEKAKDKGKSKNKNTDEEKVKEKKKEKAQSKEKYYDEENLKANKKEKGKIKEKDTNEENVKEKGKTEEQDQKKYIEDRKKYLKSLKPKRNKINKDKIDKVKNARDPKSFWSALSILRKKGTPSADIDIKDWFIFYKKLLNKGDNEPFHKANLMIRWEDIELDKETTLDEIKAEIESLSDGKAAGPDNILNELLKKLPILEI